MIVDDKEKLEDAEALYQACVKLMQGQRFGKSVLADWAGRGGIPLTQEQTVIRQLISDSKLLDEVGKAVATITMKKVLR